MSHMCVCHVIKVLLLLHHQFTTWC